MRFDDANRTAMPRDDVASGNAAIHEQRLPDRPTPLLRQLALGTLPVLLNGVERLLDHVHGMP